ncbi:MAG: hypothetical protein ACI4TL_05885, partial [Candidatus Cryptobacteroides sp.]
DSYDGTNEGMNFSSDFGSDSMIWYPASGSCSYDDGLLSGVGYRGYYWSVTSNEMLAFCLQFFDSGNVYTFASGYRASGLAIRCLKE